MNILTNYQKPVDIDLVFNVFLSNKRIHYQVFERFSLPDKILSFVNKCQVHKHKIKTKTIYSYLLHNIV